MPSGDTSSFLAQRTAHQSLPSNMLDDSRPLMHNVPALHAASYPIALESIAERLPDVQPSIHLGDTVRTSHYREDMSYSHCSRQSL